MHLPRIILSGLLLAMACATLAQQASQGPEQAKGASADERRIAELIRQLGDTSFQKREQAMDKLIEIGEPTRRQLLQARKTSDPEVQRRLTQVLDRLDKALAEKCEVHVVGLYEPRRGSFESVLPREIDYRTFSATITEAGTKAEPTPGKRVWEMLAPNVQALVKDDKLLQKSVDFRDPQSHQTLHTIRGGLNKILDDPGFYDPKYFGGLKFDERLNGLLKRRQTLSPLEVRWLNRLLFAAAFPKDILFDPELAFGELVGVEVKATNKPVILVLTSYHSVRWDVKVGPGAQLARIIVSGYEPQEVVEVDARVENYSRRGPQAGGMYFFAYRKGNPNDREGQEAGRSYDDMAAKVRQLTGKEIDSFQGQYRYDGRPFVIGERTKVGAIPKDAEVHAVVLHEAGYIQVQAPKDWLRLRKQLMDAGQGKELTPAKRIWEKLPDRIRNILVDEDRIKKAATFHRPEDHHLRHSLQETLAAIVRQPDFYQPHYFQNVPLGDEARGLLKKVPNLSHLERETLACLLLEAAFPNDFKWDVPEGYLRGTAKVRVPATEKPVILVLSAYNSIRWFVETDAGAKLHHVIVGGYHAQEVSGVNVPIVYRTYEMPDRTSDRTSAIYLRYDKKDDSENHHERSLQELQALTGINGITSFQSQYHWDGRPFVIGPPPKYPPIPKDAELHVIGVREPYTTYFDDPKNDADWLALVTAIQQQADAPESSPGKRIWNLLSAQTRQLFRDKARLNQLLSVAPPNVHSHPVAMQFGSLLNNRDLYDDKSFAHVRLPKEAQRLKPRLKTAELVEVRRFNRLLLEASFPGIIKPVPEIAGDPRKIVVQVKATGKPIVLVLTAYESMHWVVQADKSAAINQVILGGYHRQEVSGIDVPVRHRTYYHGDRFEDFDLYFYAFQRESAEYAQMDEKLRKLTGLPITSFQGRVSADGKPFVVDGKN